MIYGMPQCETVQYFWARGLGTDHACVVSNELNPTLAGTKSPKNFSCWTQGVSAWSHVPQKHLLHWLLLVRQVLQRASHCQVYMLLRWTAKLPTCGSVSHFPLLKMADLTKFHRSNTCVEGFLNINLVLMEYLCSLI